MRRFIRERAEEYRILTRDQVRSFDAWAIDQMGIPGAVLMENAGANAARWILDHLENHRHSGVSIFCGTGNNGGDGFVIARHLICRRVPTRVILCGQRGRVVGDARTHLSILERMEASIVELDPAVISENGDDILSECRPDTLIIDALFGTGLTGSVRPPYDTIIDTLNETELEIIAVDIPSGLDCDLGQPLGSAIFASATITFVAPKAGFVHPDSEDYTGDVFIAPIGIDVSCLYK
jgi:NAD(P)H-hydrate epimerase